MEQLFFSIIIPVYNTADYVGHCLDSILKQNLDKSKYEIILIDDGSSDSSPDILREYSMRFENILLIQKKNEGVSVARNVGLNSARGEYILFVDSDDFIAENSLENIYHFLISEETIDLLIGRSYITDNNSLKREVYSFDSSFFSKKIEGVELLLKHNYGKGSVWGAAFRRDFLKTHTLKFNNNLKNGEDSIFMIMCFLYAKNIQFSDMILYLVNERDGSASRSWNLDRVLYMINNLIVVKQIIKSSNWTFDQISILNFELYMIISNMFNKFYANFSIRGYFKLRYEIRKVGIFTINTGNIKLCKSKVRIYNLSIDLFAFFIILKNILVK